MKTTIYTVDHVLNGYWYFNGKKWLDSLIRGSTHGDLNKLVTVNNFKEK